MDRLKCQNCGQEMGEAFQCSFCGYGAQEPQVREMSSSERLSYQGETIDEDGSISGDDGNLFRNNRGGRHRFYVKGIQLGHSSTWADKLLNNYWLSRLAIGLVVAGVVTVLIFVALPIALMLATVGIVAWVLMSFVRR